MLIRKFKYLFIFCFFLVQSCSKTIELTGNFDLEKIPKAPDYSNPDHWAALPSKNDMADLLPSPSFQNVQEDAEVDVFFLHPTSYAGKKNKRYWNGPIDDPKVNKNTDARSIKYQASLFNGVGKIYAPRYRQANFYVYFTDKEEEAKKAFDLAYQDVSASFEYYLKHYNNNRPIIIASHSQGTTHAIRLLKEYFDGKELANRLVAAYIVGMPVEKNQFNAIKPCQQEVETGCFCSWRSFKKGFYPEKFPIGDHIAVTNPLSWKTDQDYVGKENNKGGLLRKFNNGLRKQLADAQVHQGLLWVTKPKFFGNIFITFKNYHIVDYNFYYSNVRENAIKRAEIFLKDNR